MAGEFPTTFPEVKKLGFGLMRLPGTRPDEGGQADLEEVKRMVDAFMEAGFTYFDTAFVYDGGGSEEAAKAALVERYPRESFQLATKLFAMMAGSEEAAKAEFQTSLDRTGAGYFDFYLVHNVTRATDAFNQEYGIWDFVKQKRDEGLIKHLGFSFHDKADFLEEVIAAHPEAEFVQLQINWADWEDVVVQARQNYEVARAHNLPVIVMEPVKGGSLFELPDDVAAPLRAVAPDRSFPDWALRFAASLPGVYTVLSGMHSFAQMEENIATLEQPVTLKEEELAALAQARDILAAKGTIPCTDCKYCMEGCPQEISIPGIMDVLNGYKRFNDLEKAKGNYAWGASEHPASSCIQCGACESVCPQHIEIIANLEQAAELFE